jgi:hypothetical protein
MLSVTIHPTVMRLRAHWSITLSRKVYCPKGAFAMASRLRAGTTSVAKA